MTIGPVPPYQCAAPSPLSGLLIGAALTFGIAAPQGLNFPAEYTFGTHTAAIVTAEAQKTRQWKSASGGAPPRVSQFQTASPAPFDPGVWGSGQRYSATASLGVSGRLAAVQWAAPQPLESQGDPNPAPSWQPQRSATGGSRPALGTVQYARGLFDPTQTTVADYSAPVTASAPVGLLFAATYTFGTHAQAIYDAEARKSQQWRSAQVGSAPPTGRVPTFQWAAPRALESIQGWIETPTFNPQGSLVPYQYGLPQDLWAISLQFSPAARAPAGQTSQPPRAQWASEARDPNVPAPWDPRTSASGGAPPRIGAVHYAAPLDLWPLVAQRSKPATGGAPLPPSVVLPMQWAAPATLDVIQGWVESPTFNPQGYLVPVQDAVPEDRPPTPAPRWTNASTGGAPLTGVLAAYQYQGPLPLDSIAAVTVTARIGPQGPTVHAYVGAPSDPGPLGYAALFTVTRAGSLAITGPVPAYRITISNPVDPTPAIAQKFGIASGGAVQSVALSYQWASPQPLDALGAQIGRAAPARLIGRVPPYVQAAPNQFDLLLPAAIVRSAAGYQGPTVRAFIAAPDRIDAALTGTGWSLRYSTGPIQFANMPTIRYVLADYTQRLVLSDYPTRIVLN